MPAKKPGVFSTSLLLFLILVYPTAGMLWRHDYPVFSLEIACVLGLFAAAAVLLALLLGQCRPAVSNSVLVVLSTLCLMVQFNLLLVGLVAVVLALAFSAFLFKHAFPKFLMVVLVALIAGAYLDSVKDGASRFQTLRADTAAGGGSPLIHIVMDAFIGLDGLPEDADAQALRSQVVALFRKYEFQLYPRAYTHYGTTLDSMTRAFNFRNDDENLFQRTAALRVELDYPENRWFSILSENNRPIVVYQSDAMDFCKTDLATDVVCNVYPLPNLNTIHTDIPGIWTRMTMLLRTLVGQSMIYKEFLRRYGTLTYLGISNYSPDMLDKLLADVAIQPGNIYFAHVLLPHSPLVYDQNCSLDYESEPWARFSASAGLIGNSDDTLKIRYQRYLNQAGCALRELERVFEDLDAQGVLDSSTIIVHGDHGSMAYGYTPSVHNLDHLGYRDLRQNFSLLFAAKFPGEPFRMDSEVVSLNVLLARAVSKITGKSFEELDIAVSNEPQPFLYLTDDEPLLRVNVDIFNESKAEIQPGNPN